MEAYTTAMKDGLLRAEGPLDVPVVLKMITERVEGTHGKRSVSKGDVAGLVMPWLQRDGLLKGGKKTK